MALTLGATSTHASVANATSHDITGHTVAATADNLLLVFVSADNETITGVTWDAAGANEALTLIGSDETTSINQYVYGLAGVTAGASKSITIAHSFGGICASATAIYGVDQTTSWGTAVSAAAVGTDLELTGFTASTDTTVFAATGSTASRTYTPVSPAAELHADIEDNKACSLSTLYENNTTTIGSTANLSGTRIIGVDVYAASSGTVTTQDAIIDIPLTVGMTFEV